MAQATTHVCAGFLKGKGALCANCGHPRSRHADVPLNSAGYCRECVRLWKSGRRQRMRGGVYF